MMMTTTLLPPLLTGNEILALKSQPYKLNTLLNWRPSSPLGTTTTTTTTTIPARIRSMETEGTLYSPSKTYLLVGLAGDLGRSIARHMISRGARYIVLSSRSPKIDQRWLDDVSSSSSSSSPQPKILVLPMDASKPESVDAGLRQIANSNFPPIGGVAFGPLVLQDVMFKNMDLAMLQMVLAPKVEGAKLLNEKIPDSKHLDFFVMFSSFVMVSGNPGQAAYSAANAYTHALAQQRRSRGWNASTMDIGAVFGVGFIARAGREHEYDVVKFIFDEVNEWELHSLFAEAVVAGRRNPDGKKKERGGRVGDVEVITGMPKMDPANRERIPYFDDPRFGNFKLSDRASKDSGRSGTGVVGSVKDQLAKAESMEAVRGIINEGLCGRVKGALQLTAADELQLGNPLIDQGIDSLSAVTVASWFTKNMGIDVPLLEILGGASVNDLVESAVGKLTAEMIPLCHDHDDDNDGAAPAAAAAAAAASGSSTTASSSENVSGQSTPPSLDSFVEEKEEEEEMGTEREAPLSVNQEYAFKQMSLPGLSPQTFNSTIGMYMEGPLDLARLSWSFKRALQRHDAFRTCFVLSSSGPDGGNGGSGEQPIQFVMKRPAVELETVSVPDKAAADKAFKDLESHQYDPSTGKTSKAVLYSWSPTHHLLIWAYHRLVGDGWTTEKLFVEVGTLYAGLPLDPAPSFADYAIQQRQLLDSGAFSKDLEYWTSTFSPSFRPPRLPILSLCPGAAAPSVFSSPLTQWSEHSTSARLNRMIAVRIKDRSRKHKATPMHYYLASFQVLLARLSSSSSSSSSGTTTTSSPPPPSICIGMADSNRPTPSTQSTMGYFANHLPLRLPYSPDQIFNESLSEAKEQSRLALLHSSVPYPTILSSLGLLPGGGPGPEEDDPCPLFQAVFDYKQGQTESGQIGQAKIVDSRTPRAAGPWDVALEISDDSTRSPLITVKLQKGRYGEEDAEMVMNAYLSILSTFSRNPALRVEDGGLDQGAKARE